MPITIPQLSTELRGRLQKLVAMLGSENEGEIVNAARAIGNALRAEQLDFNDFAADVSWPRCDPTFTTAIVIDVVDELKAGAWSLSEPDRVFVRAIDARLEDEVPAISEAEFLRMKTLVRSVRQRTGRRN